MTFLKKQKKLSYTQILERQDALIKQNILPQLEIEELNRLFIRMLSFVEDKLSGCLVRRGYKVKEAKQIFESAVKLDLISDLKIWNQALDIKQRIEKEDITSKDKEVLIEFMTQDLFESMKGLDTLK